MKKKTSIKNFLALSSLLLVPVMVTACGGGSKSESSQTSSSINNVVYQGIGEPSAALGNDGDIYTDTATNNMYKKENGVWVLTQNNTPANYSGEGEPSNELGVNGDKYTNTVNGAVYEKRNGTWVVIREGDTTYVVTFNLNGGHFADGSTTFPNQTVRDGYWVNEPPMQPIKEHCDFIGWFPVGSETPWNFVGTAVRGNVNLIAQYRVKEDSKIKIEVDPNNGEPSYVVETFVGDKLYPTIPERPGFSFMGWYIERTGEKYNGVVTAKLAGECLIAHWEEAKFNVAYQVEANDEITITGLLDINSVTVNIPNVINGRKVTKISERAFNSRIYIESIFIPANIKVIEDGAFRGTLRLQSINVDSANLNYCAVDGILYTKNMDTVVCYPTKGAATFTVPSTVKKIGAYCFYESKDMGIANIYLNEGLEEIGAYAFTRNELITNIQFPKSLRKIGAGAFMGSMYGDEEDNGYVSPQGVITNASLNEGLEEIGEMAFANQYFKDVFTMPTTLKTIGAYAFANCNAITKVVFSKGFENFGKNAFAGCTGILALSVDDENPYYTEKDNVLYTKDMKKLVMCPSGRTDAITIPNGVEELCDYAFYMVDELKEYNFPTTLKKIGTDCFAHTYGLKTFEIPNSVTSIGERCFDRSGVSNLTIGNGLTDIPGEAFIETKITAIEIPASVKKIGAGAFSETKSLKTVTFYEGLEEIGTGAFYRDGIIELDMPNSLKVIGANAFGNTNVSVLNIKDGLQEIGNGAFIKDGAVSIQKITVSSGNTHFATHDNILFSKDSKTVYLAAATAGVTSGDDIIVTLPEGVETIYDYAFAHIKTITKMNLPNSLKEICEGAFYNTKFKEVNFASNLKKIGEGAFASTYLEKVNFAEGLEEIGDYAFTLSDVSKITLPNSVKVIGEEAFSRCIQLTEFTLGTGVQTLKPFALADNRITGTIHIPAGLTSIGEGAFSSTVSTYGQQLQGFTVDVNNPYYSTNGHFLMNKTQTTIIATAGAHANKVVVPDTVKEIANYGMACAGARTVFMEVTLPNTLEKIGEYGMAYLAAVRTLNVPASVQYIDKYAFSDWTSKQAINFPISRDDALAKYSSEFLTRCNANVTFGAN